MRFSNADDPERHAPVAGVRFVPLRVTDIDQVLEIESDSFASPWKREHFLFELRENHLAANRVARREGRVLGYICAWRIYGEMRINNIAVRADQRRRGLGRWILRQALDEARREGCNEATLEVRPSNIAALRLYRAFGFAEIGRCKGYYQAEGEDAVVMQARLD